MRKHVGRGVGGWFRRMDQKERMCGILGIEKGGGRGFVGNTRPWGIVALERKKGGVIGSMTSFERRFAGRWRDGG